MLPVYAGRLSRSSTLPSVIGGRGPPTALKVPGPGTSIEWFRAIRTTADEMNGQNSSKRRTPVIADGNGYSIDHVTERGGRHWSGEPAEVVAVRRSAFAVVFLAVLVVAGGALAVGVGLIDLPAASDDGAAEDGSQNDSNDVDVDVDVRSERDMADTEAEIRMVVEEVTSCGTTCREVTATVSNDGDEAAENVTVETTIFTDGDEIWSNSFEVGTLEADDSATSTERIELGYGDALAVQRNDGWITIETVIEFDDGTEVFSEERQVT